MLIITTKIIEIRNPKSKSETAAKDLLTSCKTMSIKASRFNLLSPIIVPSEDGGYAYHEAAYLVPHEAVRREFERCAKALEHFDPLVNPWKAHCLHIWLTRYFLPIIHEHHDLEENVLFEEYIKAGVVAPQKLKDEHKQLLKLLYELTDSTNEMLNEMKRGKKMNESKVRDEVVMIKRIYQDLFELLMSHISDEERFWPPQLEKFGEKFYREIEHKLIQFGAQHGGRNFENIGCAVLDAMGVEIGGVSLMPGEKGWCNEKNQEEFLSNFPPPVRENVLPIWNKRYQKYKQMILSIQGTEDILHVQDNPQDIDYYDNGASSRTMRPSCCIIA